MAAGPYWNNWSDDDILDLRLCDLGVDLQSTYVQSCIVQLLGELEKKGIAFKPHFWVSDEWFCPEGIPGVAVPFFLLHPRLMALEKKFMGEVEGECPLQCLKLLRHEAGHAFEIAYKLEGHPLRVEMFGDSKSQAYPVSYKPQLRSKRFVEHLGEGYAQSHPDEDFAETFAVWLTPGPNWKVKYKNWPALEKLLAIDTLISIYKKRSPQVTKRSVISPITSISISLRDFYRKKRKRYKVVDQRFMDRQLLELFEPQVCKPRGLAVTDFLKSEKNYIISSLSQNIGLPRYQVEIYLQKWVKRSRQMRLVLKQSQTKTKRQFLDLLTKDALEDLRQGRDKIIL